MAGNHVISRFVIKQFPLMFVFDDNQPKGLLRFAHAMQGFGDGAVGVMFPRAFGEVGNALLCGSIKTSTDGKGLASRQRRLCWAPLRV